MSFNIGISSVKFDAEVYRKCDAFLDAICYNWIAQEEYSQGFLV
jgi:hypothetical protein